MGPKLKASPHIHCRREMEVRICDPIDTVHAVIRCIHELAHSRPFRDSKIQIFVPPPSSIFFWFFFFIPLTTRRSFRQHLSGGPRYEFFRILAPGFMKFSHRASGIPPIVFLECSLFPTSLRESAQQRSTEREARAGFQS